MVYNLKELFIFDQISKKQLILENRQSLINNKIMIDIDRGKYDFIIYHTKDLPPYFVAQCPENFIRQNIVSQKIQSRFGRDIAPVDFNKMNEDDIYLDHYKFRSQFYKNNSIVYILEKK